MWLYPAIRDFLSCRFYLLVFLRLSFKIKKNSSACRVWGYGSCPPSDYLLRAFPIRMTTRTILAKRLKLSRGCEKKKCDKKNKQILNPLVPYWLLRELACFKNGIKLLERGFIRTWVHLRNLLRFSCLSILQWFLIGECINDDNKLKMFSSVVMS